MTSAFWKNKCVLITGATGFIGSWLSARLEDLGADLILLTPPDHKNPLHYGTPVPGVLEDFSLINGILQQYPIDTVFHLGAQTQVGSALHHPLSTHETNIRGTYHVLEACRCHGKHLKRLLVASSDKVYGDHCQLPFRETTPLHAHYPYDVSKACSDLLASSYYHTYQLPIAITRCANVYGGRDMNWDRLIPGTVQQLYHNKPPVIRSNGLCLRDYVFIEDIINAYLLLAESLEARHLQGQAFNFGSGHPHSALDIVRLLLHLTDHQHLDPVILNQARAEIHNQYLDSTKAFNVLGWTPTFSLKEGLQRTVQWYYHFFDHAPYLQERLICTT